MTVMDLLASGGWYTEVLSVAVGPEGTVYAQNPPMLLGFNDNAYDKAITARLADNRLPNVIRLDRDETEARNRLINAFEEAGLHVPTLKEFLPTLPTDARRTERILAALVREGVLVKVSSEFVFHSTASEGLRNGLAPMKGAMIDVPKFKRLAGVSRKYAIPLLEYFYRVKVTLRIGNVRRVL